MFFKYIFFTALPCVFASVVCSHIHKEICEFTDEACVTNAHKYLLKSIIGGNELWGLKCLDPVQTDTINVDLLQDMNYILTDAHLYGMNDCDGYKLKFDENFSWYFYLICPKLTLKADYVEKGVFESSPIEGKGRLVITYDNYHIITKGEIETVTGCDGKPHLNITEYKIEELDVKDDIALTFINICTNDLDKSVKAHKHLNDNWKKVTTKTHYTLIHPFIVQLLNNIKQCLSVVPKYEMFYKNR